ncbi:class I SAM-dependent methyltransferase [Massilia sp. PAMC28688]|uniref:methyltransferase n=1 Tax=Massilia sp. PAMC28688 TaxID=2861283 RepID=UPI001C63906B|nr:class I SAM-dependent methyltransferase [Massilia sp. PAMC28688]QYF92522.1 class I SAM-dependent methyltransferase [Massilia sp. PAMC28688]
MLPASPADAPARIHWTEGGETRSARWRSESGMPAPKKVVIADDKTPADVAYRLACEGTALLWRGDFQNARQLLSALARRTDHKGGKGKKAKAARVPASPAEAFHLHRQAQSQRARTLAMLLIPFDADYRIPLRRAPDVQLACNEAYGRGEEPFVASLRELLGLIGAHEWRKNGVEIAALGERIHPHYGVFSPIRGEYVALVTNAPLPPGAKVAFDVGTGTGVLAAVLAKRGLQHIVGTDMDARALSCARDNLQRLGLERQVELMQADLFPERRADLIVCNPPWLPGRPSSSIEHAIYDPDSRMLRAFLAGVAAHLAPGGEAWLILSDLAEHLGLRPRAELMAWIAEGGLAVQEKIDVRPTHPKASDSDDPLHAARSAELTSLWRLTIS